MNQSVQRYNKVAIILHWLIGFMILGMLALGFWMSDLPKDAKVQVLDLFNLGFYSINYAEPTSLRAFYFNLHKSIGLSVMALIFFRVFWRLTHVAPAFPDTMNALEKKLADVMHRLLYLLMLAVPLSGAIMAAFSKYGVVWFGTPLLKGLDNNPVREVFKESHELLAAVLLALVVLHVASAIKHKVIDKDDVMKRMSMH
jgi:cytochrome b561